ncbi:MAG: peptide-methionine (S)-S-oxide reductase MsrA [Candidatus Saccharimonadales bacterium]
MKQIILGGGCFWCTEAVFQRLDGVTNVASGYAGGSTTNPDYYKVATGTTGHAEVIRVEYDENVVSLSYLLDIFFKTHDPTTLNQQGADKGTEYRSIVMYTNDSDLRVITSAIAEAQKDYLDPIVTEVVKGDVFYEAEPEHKDYYLNNAAQPYCQIRIAPKMEKLEQILKEQQ